jgi:tRNA(Leu) C34 or U34 (ribose-2'-O)-methylase TrmL
MKGYKDVSLINVDRPFDLLPSPKAVPVCVEFGQGSEDLVYFEHPFMAVYVFGPEDGGVSKAARSLCQRFVHINTKHCLNLASALATVLYDRHQKDEDQRI